MDKSSALRILKLEPSATRAEAKKAFRSLAKSCHPDRFSGRPGAADAADAEERMKLLNQAFALVMPLLPEGEEQAADPDSEPVSPETKLPKRDGLFSMFRKRVGGLKKRRRADSRPKRAGASSPPGTGAVKKRPGASAVRQQRQRRRPSGAPSFESFLNGAGTASASQSPGAFTPGSSHNDAYSRYVRLKNQMQVQRRRPRQAVVSRVEKISPVHRVRRVGDE